MHVQYLDDMNVYFQISMPSGAYVHADIHDWGMNIDAHLLSSDFGKTEGLCGNFDGPRNNDLQHKDTGVTANPSNREEVNQFVDSWK